VASFPALVRVLFLPAFFPLLLYRDLHLSPLRRGITVILVMSQMISPAPSLLDERTFPLLITVPTFLALRRSVSLANLAYFFALLMRAFFRMVFPLDLGRSGFKTPTALCFTGTRSPEENLPRLESSFPPSSLISFKPFIPHRFFLAPEHCPTMSSLPTDPEVFPISPRSVPGFAGLTFTYFT